MMLATASGLHFGSPLNTVVHMQAFQEALSIPESGTLLDYT